MQAFDAMDIVASGLAAQRTRMDVAATNLANVNTTQTLEGGPYRKKIPVLEAVPAVQDDFAGALSNWLETVRVKEVLTDDSPPRLVHDPGHPNANKEGYVQMPNINMVDEMVTLMTASRNYEASLTAMRTLVAMTEKALSIGQST
jgi:flagellar basal-body rod protein FlgC